MTNILFFIAGIALGFFIKGKMKLSSDTKGEAYFDNLTKDELGEIREEAQKALTERTEKRKAKILELLKNEALHKEELKTCNLDDSKAGRVTRADIEKLLGVSDVTARKYLDQLEKENKIKQVGDSGPDVYYTPSDQF